MKEEQRTAEMMHMATMNGRLRLSLLFAFTAALAVAEVSSPASEDFSSEATGPLGSEDKEGDPLPGNEDQDSAQSFDSETAPQHGSVPEETHRESSLTSRGDEQEQEEKVGELASQDQAQ